LDTVGELGKAAVQDLIGAPEGAHAEAAEAEHGAGQNHAASDAFQDGLHRNGVAWNLAVTESNDL
jgi:hypothetical protein